MYHFDVLHFLPSRSRYVLLKTRITVSSLSSSIQPDSVQRRLLPPWHRQVAVDAQLRSIAGSLPHCACLLPSRTVYLFFSSALPYIYCSRFISHSQVPFFTFFKKLFQSFMPCHCSLLQHRPSVAHWRSSSTL